MDKKLFKAVLLNLPVAGDVDTTSDTSKYQIKGLHAINVKDYLGYTATAYAAEVSQVMKLGEGTAPTITAATLYKLAGGNPNERDFEYNQELHKYSTKSPSVLTGNAATDRFNVYASLVYKINANRSASQFAGNVVTLTHVASTVFTINTGKNSVWVKCSVSGAVGFITANADSTTTSTKLCVVNGILPVLTDILTQINNPYEGTTTGAGGPSTAVTAVTAGVGLRTVDKAGYYNAKGTRKGPSTWAVQAGFNKTDLVVGTAGVVSSGVGANLAQLVPVRETSSSNLVWGGKEWFPVNEAPVVGSQYTIIDIKSKNTVNTSAMLDAGPTGEIIQRIYADKNAAGYAAFLAAIAALV